MYPLAPYVLHGRSAIAEGGIRISRNDHNNREDVGRWHTGRGKRIPVRYVGADDAGRKWPATHSRTIYRRGTPDCRRSPRARMGGLVERTDRDREAAYCALRTTRKNGRRRGMQRMVTGAVRSRKDRTMERRNDAGIAILAMPESLSQPPCAEITRAGTCAYSCFTMWAWSYLPKQNGKRMYEKHPSENELFEAIERRMEHIQQTLDVMAKTRGTFDGDTLLDNHDLCMMLNVTKRTLARYRQKRLIPFYKIDRKVFYRTAEIREFMKKSNRRECATSK